MKVAVAFFSAVCIVPSCADRSKLMVSLVEAPIWNCRLAENLPSPELALAAVLYAAEAAAVALAT